MARTVGWCLCLILVLVSGAWATEFRTGKNVSVEADEVIDDDLFAAGSSVRIAGRVTGDVFAAGHTVQVTGPVDGSVMAAGRAVRVTGDVAGSVRAAGCSVSLSGPVGRNAAVAGMNLLLADTARVVRDLHAAGMTIDADGNVGRKATLAGETAIVRGEIGDRLRFEGDEITLGQTAKVVGDVVYRSKEPLEIEGGAYIGGKTKRLARREPMARMVERERSWFMEVGVRLFVGGAFFVIVFVFGTVGLAAVPRVFGAAANAMGNRPWWNLLVGVVTLLVMPPLAVLLCLTVIGIPIGALGMTAWGMGLVFSAVPVGIFIGRWLVTRIAPRATSPYLGLLIGLVLLTLVGMVPVLGWLTMVVTMLLGLGVYVRAGKGVLVELRERPV